MRARGAGAASSTGSAPRSRDDTTTAAHLIGQALPHIERLGGSIAQRGVIHEALVRSLVDCGRLDDARQHLAQQMDSGRTVHWVPRELAPAG